jgi:hypothetical protein
METTIPPVPFIINETQCSTASKEEEKTELLGVFSAHTRHHGNGTPSQPQHQLIGMGF